MGRGRISGGGEEGKDRGRIEEKKGGREEERGGGGKKGKQQGDRKFDRAEWATDGFSRQTHDSHGGVGGMYATGAYYEPRQTATQRAPSIRVADRDSWQGLEVVCSGLNNCGQLGQGAECEGSCERVAFGGGVAGLVFACGEAHTAFAVQGKAGGVACVGCNDAGQLGCGGDGECRYTPAEAAMSLASIQQSVTGRMMALQVMGLHCSSSEFIFRIDSRLLWLERKRP